MSKRRYPWTMVVVSVMATAMAACSSSPGASTPISTPTSGPGATAAPTAPATASASKALPSVDLTLSGPYPVVAKGTTGQCNLGKDSAGTAVKFGFSALEADYPGLGQGLFVDEGNNGFVTIKWLVSPSVGYINMADIKGVSADHHSITIDADLGGGSVVEHLKGTITCP